MKDTTDPAILPPSSAPGSDGSRPPDPPEPAVTARQFLQIFTAVMLPMFLAAVDQTLLATATPAIAADLGGLRDTTWIALGYLLATTVTIPVYGRLGDRYGRRRVLMIAVAIFAVGSIACGVAQSLLQLALARVVQGLGGGGLMVLSQALIGELVPPRQRARFQGYFAANFTMASLVGPVVGGYVVSHASWRWLFLVNVPLALLAAWRINSLPHSPTNAASSVLRDWHGVLLFAAAATCSLLWITFAGHRFEWSSTASLAVGGAALCLLAILVWHERRVETPFLPVELLRVRGVAIMAGTVVCFASCFFACVFFLPIYLQLGAGIQAKHAGLLLLPLTLGMVIGSTTTGRVVTCTGRPTPMPVVGLSVAAAALLGLGLIDPTPARIIALGVVCGAGFGTVMPTAQLVLQTLAGRSRLGAAAATVSLARSLGASIGTALFGALVFALVPGIHLESVITAAGAADAQAIRHAFQIGFVAASAVAVAGAVLASRLPRLVL